MKQLVVAHSLERAIGKGMELPWGREMPRDLSRFRTITINQAVIMGRKTFESIGRPLPSRTNIVLSSRGDDIEGCRVVSTLEEGFSVAEECSVNSFVIGGMSVYKEGLQYVDRLHITEIDASFPDADTHFAEIDPSIWHLDGRIFHPKDANNTYDCWFTQYTRNQPE